MEGKDDEQSAGSASTREEWPKAISKQSSSGAGATGKTASGREFPLMGSVEQSRYTRERPTKITDTLRVEDLAHQPEERAVLRDP